MIALRLRMALAAAAVAALVGSTIAFGGSPAMAASHCASESSVVACENSKPGTAASVWDIDGAGDPSIQGFATDISVNVGNRIDFKIDTNASAYTIRIFRTGWYQGLGARLITSISPSAALPQRQPQCITEAATEIYDCGTWGVSASWNVPPNAVSGVYIALLDRTDTGGQSHITFIVRNDSSTAEILYQTSDPTWHAYNSYGGSDFYKGGANGRAYKVSYNRPFATRNGVTARDFYFASEYAQVRFMERNGYDVTYASGVDTDRFGSNLLKHKVFLSVGHDEYWSGAQRANIEAARDAGVNLQFLTGNEGYWRTRYEPAASTDATAYRTLVSYKETWGNAKIDPSAEWTGTSRDPRFAPQSTGAGVPENGLTGTMYMVNNDDLPITVSAREGKNRIWRNTSLASLGAGSTAQLALHTVGYESNEDLDNGFRPAGLIRLSTTVGPAPEYLQDYGNTVAPGTTTHHTTMYRAPSGALVFSAGSIQWAWGLDQKHDGVGAPADPRMQQAQVNLLADMGAQPRTLMSGLVAATPSTDTTPPTVTISSPAPSSTIANGALVTVSGSASDTGGAVAGVEVSTDGGKRWHPAQGTTSWSYSYNQRGRGAQSIRVRAIDDSANYPSTPASVALSVSGPYSVFGNQVPAIVDTGDTSPVELGLRFSPEINGFVSGVRFYKSAGNLGVHTGSLWDTAGTRLASVTFSGETAAGWQTAAFSSAVPVTAGQSYLVSYTAPRGRYSVESFYWPFKATASPPLATASGFGTPTAGVYGSAGQFPTQSFRSGNYFVDAIFDVVNTTPLAALSQWPQPGATEVPVSTTVSARFSNDVVASSVSLVVSAPGGASVPGTLAYDPVTRTATFTPSAVLAASTSYSVALGATSSTGGPLVTGGSWSFTTAASTSASCPCSLFTGTVPEIITVADSGPVTLGVRFTARTTGAIAGIKFYKGPANTGTHTGALWSATGTQLGTATFVNETASGWQAVYFGSPIAVTAGTEYLASYRAPAGGYSATLGAFSGSGFVRGPLGVGSNAGLYTYGSGAPTSTSTTNYFVDVVFVTDSTPTNPVSVLSSSPTAGQTGVAPSALVSAVLSETSGTETPTIGLTSAAGAVSGTVAWAAATRTVSFTPSAPLANSTQYTATVSIGGAVPTGGSWSFTTAAPATFTGQFSLLGDQAPLVDSTNDPSPVELGMSFAVSQPGSVTGIRFYKGKNNTGTHTGSLWSATGARLATVTFANETVGGWQTATLATPLALTAGQRYIVSYLAPKGRYSNTPGYFSTLRTSGPLTADTTVNGRFLYGAAGGFPTGTWNASNYFVDVVFVTGQTVEPAPVSVLSSSPSAGQTGVAPSVTVSATLSADSPVAVPALGLSGPAGDVAGTSAYNAASRTVTFTPAAVLDWSTQYTATASIRGAAVTNGTWSFTTAASPPLSGEFTLLGNLAPEVGASADSAAVELGMAFSVSQSGAATGIRFHKGAGNGGTHVGTLWRANGERLASVTFAGESSAGWQSAKFSSSVPLTAGERYVVSYLAPQGRYSVTSNYFSTQRTSGPLTAEITGNGRYLYGSAGGFPTTPSGNAANYFVDVTYLTSDLVPVTPPPAATVSSTTPTAGASAVAPTTTVSAQLANVGTRTPAITLTGPAGAVPGTVNWASSTGSLTFTPTAPLAWSTSYQASVSIDGAALTSWSFTTAPEPVAPDTTIFASTSVPADESWNDTASVQVGTRFSSSAAGTVTGIRYYKGTLNTGTHTGYLWSATGQSLAQVTFVGETERGWQTAMLSTPVAIQSGVEYRVGLHNPAGRYAISLDGLRNPLTSGPLTVPASGGAYTYSTNFPATVSNHNFWVDVLFTAN